MRETRVACTSIFENYSKHEHGIQLELLSQLLDQHPDMLCLLVRLYDSCTDTDINSSITSAAIGTSSAMFLCSRFFNSNKNCSGQPNPDTFLNLSSWSTDYNATIT